MSFFKKLFNRVAGKPAEDASPLEEAEAPEAEAETPSEPLAEVETEVAPSVEDTPLPIEEDEAPAITDRPEEPERPRGWFARLTEGLSKSSRSIVRRTSAQSPALDESPTVSIMRPRYRFKERAPPCR